MDEMSDENEDGPTFAEVTDGIVVSDALAAKAWRKVLLVAIANVRRDTTGMALSIFHAVENMPEGPARDEIVTDWKSALDAEARLSALLEAELADVCREEPAQ
jgi:hypothetical protein